MAHNQFASIAMFIALAFLVMALAACSTPQQTASLEGPKSTPEFHGAHIGGDALRERLPAE